MSCVYDEAGFFDSYAEMDRSRRGLAAAGEWPQFRAMFPPLEGKRVLDLGCGYGWHCAYAAEHGAACSARPCPPGSNCANQPRTTPRGGCARCSSGFPRSCSPTARPRC